MYKKALLAAAIAAVSSTSFAMQAMSDDSLSATAGQAGIDVTLSTQLNMDMYVHDTDGFTGYTDSGAIVMRGIGIDDGAGGNAGIKIAIDAGATGAATNDAILQVNVSTTTATRLNLGTLTVANSNRPVSWGLVAGTETGTLMSLGSLTMAATPGLLNIQMGHESAAQGAWMEMKTTFTNGLSITGFSLNDAGGAISGGGIGTDLTVLDNGGTDLTADIKIDADTTGLKLTLAQLGSAGNGMDIHMANLKLGDVSASGTAIGDVEVVGLNLNNSVVTLVGH